MTLDSHFLITSITSFCVLLLLFSAVRHFARNSIIPADAWILLCGIGYGLFLKYQQPDYLPNLTLHPELVLLVMLPILIFASGRQIDLKSMKAEALPVSFFAIFGVLGSCAIIGAIAAWLLNIPLVHGLLLGAAAGATDPAAVSSIFRNFHIPEKLESIIEGESLFNDGATVVVFSVISGLVLSNEMLDLSRSAAFFFWAILVAVPLGLIIGWTGAKLLKVWRENNVFFDVTMTFIVAFSAYLIAEEFVHVSGVISVLFAAVSFYKTRQKDGKKLNPKKRFGDEQHTVDEFWNYLSVVVNMLLFFTLGVATGNHNFEEVPGIAVIGAIISVILARSVITYLGSGLLRLCGKKLPILWQHLMVLGGLRGAVTAALILLIPEDYEHRGAFLCLAFAMVCFTLLVQPILIRLYLKKYQKSL